MTVAIASTVAAVMDTRADSLASVKPGECAHSESAVIQPARLVHIGARGAAAPACSTQPRQRLARAARSTAAAPALSASAENAALSNGEEVARGAMRMSRFAHRLRAASSRDSGCALP